MTQRQNSIINFIRKKLERKPTKTIKVQDKMVQHPITPSFYIYSEESKNEKKEEEKEVKLIDEIVKEKIKRKSQILIELNSNGDFLKKINIDLIDEELMYLAIKKKKNPSAYLSEKMRKNFKISFLSTSIDPKSIEYFDRKLRCDIFIVLNSVSKNGMLLKFASNELKDNSFIVLKAYQNNPNSIIHSSNRLYENQYLLIIDNFNFKFTNEKILLQNNIFFNFN